MKGMNLLLSSKYYVEPLIYNERPYGEVPPLYTEDPHETNHYFFEGTKLKKTPKVSIGVLAYKYIEKTKRCVESIIRYVGSLDYELILLDNASEDNNETLNYFQSVPSNRKKIIQITEPVGMYYGCIFGTNVLINHSCGDIFILISNDIVITENCLQNIVACMESDEKIGVAVPMMSNAYMLQNPGLQFENDDEMFEAAKQFNKYDPCKWEERLCYVGPMAAYKREALFFVGKYTVSAEWHMSDKMMFSGYKVILLGDTWVHHDHDYSTKQATHGFLKDEKFGRCNEQMALNLRDGLGLFSDVMTFEKEMTSMITSVKDNLSVPNILSVDVKAGQGLLDLKNRLRNYGIFKTNTTSFVTESKYHRFISTVCDEMIIDRIDYLEEDIMNKKFDYIIVGTPINLYKNPTCLLSVLTKHLNSGGQMLFKLKNTTDINALLKIIGEMDSADDENPIHISFKEVETHLANIGVKKFERKSIFWNTDQKLIDNLASVISYAGDNSDLSYKVSNVLTKEYLYCIQV